MLMFRLFFLALLLLPTLALAQAERLPEPVPSAAAQMFKQLEKLLADKTPPVQFTALAAYARHHGEQAWGRAESITANIPDNARCLPDSRA